MAIGVTLVAAYAFVAYIGQTIPATPPFDGWMMVLTRGDDPAGAIGIHVRAREPGAPGNHPPVLLDVVACGDRPLRGMLLLGGNARLLRLNVVLPPAGEARQPRAVGALQTAAGEDVRLPLTEAITFTLSQLTRCIRGVTPGTFGTPITFVGDLRAPVSHHVALFGVRGPRHTQSWPAVGAVPWMSAQELGAFSFRQWGGGWMRPVKFEADVSVGTLTNRAQVETSRPPVADTTSLRWASRAAMTPVARVVNIDSQSTWQNAMTVAAIGFGIGGSLLAALLFETLAERRRATAPNAAAQAVAVVPASPPSPNSLDDAPLQAPVKEPPSPPAHAQKRFSVFRASVVASVALFVGFALGRVRRPQ